MKRVYFIALNFIVAILALILFIKITSYEFDENCYIVSIVISTLGLTINLKLNNNKWYIISQIIVTIFLAIGSYFLLMKFK